ncbi:Lrp/AsnC family transcriptional regulator [Hyphomicrobium sp.]|uniref:Lrp/AsnC family transcriptional regulator n=1 Tax=Hyphomicrobium sp. TaxID=82 RepID=UPI002CA19757|nr:Lrp/AsnC family transcriptional regulator [Hyphomicrobium sp.]HVZ03917.1 Lrp/AsnC family transcriptional regulator [Hyphomicrobium sp.]
MKKPTISTAPILELAQKRPASNGNESALDEIDLAIIRILQDDGRAPFTAIAKQLELSEGAVRNRVNNLVDSKVLRIIGVADPIALGYDAFAMVGLKLAAGFDPQDAACYFRERDEVTYVLFVAGRYDLLVEVICETHDQLALFLREHCYNRVDLASVEAMVGLAMYKNMLKWGQP